MNLTQALSVSSGDVVVFVGAGGKTTSMFRLAAELAAAGLRVVTTTTTRIAADELRRAPHALGLDPVLPADFTELLEEYRHILVYGELTLPDKVQGLPEAWVDEHLAPYPDIDVLLVEADGSRRLPFKAPYGHEPPIPASATVVVPVVGLRVLGQPLDAEHVYGAELIAAQTPFSIEDTVSPEMVAAVLGSPSMGLKAVPPGARIVPLLNQASDDNLPQAREIARRLLASSPVDGVAIGAVVAGDPVREVQRRVCGIVLAAGESSRMGEAKLLLPWGDDSTIIREVCTLAGSVGLDDLVVVTGGWREPVEAAIDSLPQRVIYNPDYAQGEMISSVQAGLRALPENCSAVLIFLGDQPNVTPEIVADLLVAYASGRGRIVAPVYEGRRGHPVLIDRAFWQELLGLPPGKAPRDVLRRHPEAVCEIPVETAGVVFDIDTPEDYRRAKARRS